MHRVQQILNAIQAELLDSNAFGDRVYLQRDIALSELEQELPAVCVFMGPNEPLVEYTSDSLIPADGLLADDGLQSFDFRLTVIITVVAAAAKESDVLVELLVLDSAVQASVMAARMHGLDEFVIGTAPKGHPEGPQIEAGGERIAGSLESRYGVDYQLQATTSE